MEREPAGNEALPAASRSPGARAIRRGSIPPKQGGNATSATRPKSRSNGQPPAAAAWPAEGLSEPVELDAESAEGELSEPVMLGSAPPQIASPEEGKPTHLAKSRYHIALCAIALLAFVVVASFVTLWLGQSIDNLTRLLEIIFAPIIAVVAAAVAFYYHGSSR